MSHRGRAVQEAARHEVRAPLVVRTFEDLPSRQPTGADSTPRLSATALVFVRSRTMAAEQRIASAGFA